MQSSEWRLYKQGQTIGETGSENGIILRDEEHPEGVRITLERDGHTPFAITCGIYGWFVHTRFFATEAVAEQAFEAMKPTLVRVAAMVPLKSDPQAEERLAALYEAFDTFTKAFP